MFVAPFLRPALPFARERRLRSRLEREPQADAEAPSLLSVPGHAEGVELGIRVSDLTPEITQRFNLPETTGVIVMRVEPESKAAEADVRAGDIIKEINHKSIESVSDYKSILEATKTDDPVNLFIWRKNRGFLVIKMTK